MKQQTPFDIAVNVMFAAGSDTHEIAKRINCVGAKEADIWNARARTDAAGGREERQTVGITKRAADLAYMFINQGAKQHVRSSNQEQEVSRSEANQAVEEG